MSVRALPTPRRRPRRRAGRRSRARRPRALGVHTRMARHRHRDRRRLDRRARRLRRRARSSMRPAASSFPASSTRTCISSRRSCCPTSSRGSCCRSERRRSSLDPHELANVLGTDGVHWLLDACEGLAARLLLHGVVVRARLEFESPRRPLAERRPREPAPSAPRPRARRDDEFPRSRRRRSERELDKLRSPRASQVDGHAPGLLGKELNAYVAAGIRSDHEALTPEEGRERLRDGMWLLIREASMARNLQALLPLVQEFGTDRIAFCTDDRDPEDIAENGHINGDGARGGRGTASRRRTRSCSRRSTRRPGTGSGTSARSRPATRPTCCCCPTWSGSSPSSTLKSGRPRRRDPAARRARMGASTRCATGRSSSRRSRASRGRAARRARSGSSRTRW